MVDTRPIFYVAPVTQQLCTAVEQGQYPEQATEVRKCMVGAETQSSEGMERLDSRLEALKHHALFRSLAKELLSEILAGDDSNNAGIETRCRENRVGCGPHIC